MDLKRNDYQRNSSWNAPYTFSGKEKDVETGYSYFGARYYDSGLSIWLSVDPMSDKYPNMSPYNYCANNPVILVDPDGRDIYTFDDNGNIYLFEANDSKTDHLVVLDKNGNVSRDKNGNIKKESFFGKQLSQEVTKGVFDPNKPNSQKNSDGNTILDFKGNKSEASGVFGLLADNTSVEWGMAIFKEDNEIKVGTSHNTNNEAVISQIAIQKSEGNNLILYNHSHPYIISEGTWQGATGGTPSGIDNDRGFWNDILEKSPGAKLGIRFRGQTDYYHNGN